MCQKTVKPPNKQSFYCDKWLKWIHLDCSELSENEFGFYSNSDRTLLVENVCKTV